jgi:pimeloyl-ACP methyl ester carboxylesterase
MISRRRKWIIITLLFGTFVVALFVANAANHVPSLPVPPGITKRTAKISLQGESVPVDVYLPKTNVETAPVVIVAHGFTRNRRVMADWGHFAALHGMIALVPNLPSFANHGRNARAIEDLIRWAHEPGRSLQPRPNGEVGLIGHSAGGFATLLAAVREPRVRCWVGLDPVDFGDHGLLAVKSLNVPGLMLLAESGAWNRHGNAVPWLAACPGSLTALRVHGSTHCDPEMPTSRMAQLVCGKTDAARYGIYQHYALALLEQTLNHDPKARDQIALASKDARVHVLPSATAKPE